MNIYLESAMGVYAKWILPGVSVAGHGEDCQVPVTEEDAQLVEKLETVVAVVESRGVRYAG